MKSTLSSLLYYDLSTIKHGDIRKGLREYSLLLSALIESLKAFEKGDLEKFDGLVGENACQIRAIKIILIHKKNRVNLDLKFITQNTYRIISELLEKKIRSLESSKLSLKDIFEKYDLEVFLNEEDAFLLASFILTLTKETYTNTIIVSSLEEQKKERCSPEKIKLLDENISYSFGSKLTSHLRKLLSKLSVEFVQKLAADLGDPHLSYMVSDQFITQHNSLYCTPMYWTYKVLLHAACQENIPIVAKVKHAIRTKHGFILRSEKHLYFTPEKDLEGKFVYRKKMICDQDLDKAACIIEGFTTSSEGDWNNDDLSNSLLEAILAGAADHRQYPNSKNCSLVENSEHDYFKQMAIEKGFSRQNPSTFLIQHVFPSQVNKKIKKQTV